METMIQRSEQLIHTPTSMFVSLLLLALGAWAPRTASADAVRFARRAERPAAQAGASGPTVSFLQRVFSLPAAGTLQFDYFVDSEAGGDFLRVRVDGEVRFEESGALRTGRSRVTLPAGDHVVGFSYEKNPTVSAGTDTAWVDDVHVLSGGAKLTSVRFDDRLLAVPSQWERGGTGGGFQIAPHDARRSFRRPAEGTTTGYTPGGVRTASQRTITWPDGGTKNTLAFAYYVDSELDHDFLRVLIDGQVAFSVSGRERTGRAEVDVGGSGAHSVRFEYAKDESVDEGLDDARILHFEARRDQQTLGADGLDGRAIGESLSDWQTPNDAIAGFVIGAGLEPRLYVAPGAAVPVVDALVDSTYKSSTKANIMQAGSTTEPNGRADFLFSAPDRALFTLLRLPARTPAIGSEQGRVTLYLDALHGRTQRGVDCDGSGALPGAEDRRIQLDYTWNGGVAGVTSTQTRGACDADDPWEPATAAESWDVSLAVIEGGYDPGYVHLELRIALPIAGVLDENMFGIGVRADVKSGVTQFLPAYDALPLREDDAASWMSIHLGAQPTRFSFPSHVLVEGVPRR